VVTLFSKFLAYFVGLIFLAVGLFVGCSLNEENNSEKENPEPTITLPSLQEILPDDPYLLLPLENVGFQLTFTREVDPIIVEQSTVFKPELDFTVQSSEHDPTQIILQPREKLQSDTTYTLEVHGVRNESTGKSETFKFNFRTEFQGDKEIINPQWSHDGEEIAYLVRTGNSDTAELWKVDIKEGKERLLASDLSWPGNISWSPDDSSILYTKMVALPDKNFPVPEVCSVSRKGQVENIIVSARELKEVSSDVYPSNVYPWWSPDGKKIALQLDMPGVDAHSDLPRYMAVVDSDGGKVHQVEGQIFAGWQEGNSLMVLKTHQDYNYGRSYRYDLFQVDADGDKPVKLLLGEGKISNFDRSSQSSNLDTLVIGQWKSLNTVYGFKNEGTELLLYDVPQNSLTNLGLDSGYQKHPAISPRENVIAFAANKDGNWNLYMQQNGIAKQLTTDSAHDLYPAWSPDKNLLAFVSTRSGTEEIWVLNLSNDKIKQLTGN